MRVWVIFGVGAAAALLGIVSTGLGWWNAGTSAGRAPAAPLTVRASFEPTAVLYGDPLVAEVEVDYDAKAIAAGGIHVEPDFVPYTTTSAPEIRSARVGRTGIVRYRYSLVCVTQGCLPTNGPRQVKFPAVTVTGVSGGKTVKASARWPLVLVSSRLAKSDLAGSIRFRHPASLPAPTFPVAPGPLADGLVAVAALLALTAFALLGGIVARHPRRRRARKLTALELALAYTRESALRADPADRRKALELLAEAVGRSGGPALARTTAETAWSEEPPTPARTVELADEADRARTDAP